MALELYDVALAVVGIAIFGIALFPRIVSDQPISVPIFYIAFGYGLFSLPLGIPTPDPIAHSHLAERLAEMGVIIALMTVGLKIDRPPGLARWASTWRLLAITMPLSIAGAALLGWWGAGFLLPTAVLLGAVIAPTDPVLASEVQVEKPGESTEEQPREDADGMEEEVRFALSSEAGLNDGLAFPFTYAAVSMAMLGVAPGNWVGEWFLVDVVYRIVVGAVGGLVLGWVTAKLTFAGSADSFLSQSMQGLEAIAGTLLTYGLVEVVGGYGFIGVFVAATVLRQLEREHGYQEQLHDISEKSEQLLMAAIMMLFGGAIAGGLFDPLTATHVAIAAAIVFVVRPLAGIVGLLGFDRSWLERGTIAFFGVRGIGSFYYLAYGINQAPFRDADLLWALVGLVVLVSVVIHGTTATPWVERELDERL